MTSSGPRREVRYWAAAGAVALVLALGNATPLGAIMYRLPILGYFRAQGRYLVIVDFAAAFLAACGLAAARRRAPRARLVGVLLASVLAGAAIAVAAMSGTLRAHAGNVTAGTLSFNPLSNGAVGIPVLIGCAFAVVLATSSSLTPRLAGAGLATVVVVELATFAPFLGWRVESPPVEEVSFPAQLSAVRDLLRANGGRWLTASGVFASREALPPERSSLWGVPSVSKFSTIMPRRYAELTGLQQYGGVTGAWSAMEDRGLDLAGARLAAVRADDVHAIDQRKWRFIATVGDASVFENAEAMPRAWIAREAIALDERAQLTAIHTSRLPDGRTFDPSTMALIAAADLQAPRMREYVAAHRPVDSAQSGPPSSVRVTREDATSVELQIDDARGGVLVLSDLYYPGWKASVDGAGVDLAVVNHAQRGVAVEAGAHVVRFVYQPGSLRAGAAVSFAGACGLVALPLIGRRRRRARER
jgi:hypothetical protein